MAVSVQTQNIPLSPSKEAPSPTEAGIQEFLSDFYRYSDNAKDSEEWVRSFTDDAQVQIGADKAHGTREIRQFRGRQWARVAERQHKVLKVFPGQASSDDDWEGMLVGSANLTTRDGRGVDAAFSAQAALRREADGWKLSSYRVWVQGE